ncbi:MAG: OmpA family protein [Rhodospirillales bacterium]|nr:OmpA family protein [Rhodospirillales bacterium]MDH3968476.1 OmpA family protein [Rhodospirillales bacterium]
MNLSRVRLLFSIVLLIDLVGSAPATSVESLLLEVGDRAFFAAHSSELSAETAGVVTRLADWLEKNPETTILIEGHADDLGSDAYNQILSEQRAWAVEDHLIALGIEPRRISTVGFGNRRPAMLGSDEESLAQNRRVNFRPNCWVRTLQSEFQHRQQQYRAVECSNQSLFRGAYRPVPAKY